MYIEPSSTTAPLLDRYIIEPITPNSRILKNFNPPGKNLARYFDANMQPIQAGETTTPVYEKVLDQGSLTYLVNIVEYDALFGKGGGGGGGGTASSITYIRSITAQANYFTLNYETKQVLVPDE